jgi:methyl-accepting chemotaxis protein WspA
LIPQVFPEVSGVDSKVPLSRSGSSGRYRSSLARASRNGRASSRLKKTIMNNGTVRARIILGFSAVILLMVGLCIFAYVQLQGIATQTTALNVDSVPGLYVVGRLQATSISTHASVQQLVLESDPARIQLMLDFIQEKNTEWGELSKQYEATITLPKDRENFVAVNAAYALYLRVRTEVVRLGSDPRNKAEAAGLMHGKLDSDYEKLHEALGTELAFNKANAADSADRIHESVARAQTGMMVALLIGFVLAFAAGFLVVQAVNRPLVRLLAAMELMRKGDYSQKIDMANGGEFGILAEGLNLLSASLQEMVRRVQKSGLQVNTSATEIAATAQEQLSTASEVAATTSEIGATSKEISATSRELAGTIRDIAEVAEKTAVLAGNGQAGLGRMTATMQQVMDASSSISSRLATLSEKAGNIGTVVITITRVADQTNLLSLNAAIEAEKAGDYGRGFAVVATEIRRLADQTAVATGDIEQMVKEMQSAVAAGVMSMDKFSEEVRRGVEVVQQVSIELSQIIHHVQALTPNFETVSDGMQSQSLGAQQISDSLSQLSEAAQQTVESLRQSNSAIGQLNEAARGLQDGVARFTIHA